MIEFQDRNLPADMFGLDEILHEVDVIIPANHPLASNIHIFIDGKTKEESLVALINLSARYLLRYRTKKVPKGISGRTLLSNSHRELKTLELDENGEPVAVRVDFTTVTVCINPSIRLDMIPKPWLPWASHPAMTNPDHATVKSTSVSIIGNVDDDPDDMNQPMPASGNTARVGPSGESGVISVTQGGRRQNISLEELQRRLQEAQSQRRSGSEEIQLIQAARSAGTDNYQQYLAAIRGMVSANMGVPAEMMANRNGDAIAPGAMAAPSGMGDLSGGLLGGSLQAGAMGFHERVRTQAAAQANEEMRRQLAQAQAPAPVVEDRGPITGGRRAGRTLRNLLGMAQALSPQATVGVDWGDSPDPSPNTLRRIVSNIDDVENATRQASEFSNNIDAYHTQRLNEATIELERLYRMWATQEDSSSPADWGSSSGFSNSSSGSSSSSSESSGEPARQFGVAENFPIGSVVRSGPDNTPIGVVIGSRVSASVGGTLTEELTIRTDLGQEVAMLPPPLAPEISLGDGITPSTVNRRLFQAIGQIWLHLDTWANCLTPINNSRRYGELGRRMEAHLQGNNMASPGWTQRTADLINELRAFSGYVFNFLEIMTEATSRGVSIDRISPPMTDTYHGLIGVFRSFDRPDRSGSDLREMVYDHLHQHYVSSTTNPAAHPMFAGPIGMQGPVGSIGSPGPGGISDAQRDWEAQTPIHDEGEDDFPF